MNTPVRTNTAERMNTMVSTTDRYDRTIAVLLARLATDTGAQHVRLFQRADRASSWTETACAGPPSTRTPFTLDTAHRALHRESTDFGILGRTTLLRIGSPVGEVCALVSVQTAEPISPTSIVAAHDSWDLLSFTIDTMTRVQELSANVADSDRRRRQALAQTSVDSQLTECARGGRGLAALVQTCGRLTGKSVTLFDIHGRIVTFAHIGGPVVRTPQLREILAAGPEIARDDEGVHVAGADRMSGLARRSMVAQVAGAGERFGYLVVDEHPVAFTALDEHTVTRAAHLLGYEYSVQKRVARVAWNARSSLTRQLVRGTVESADLAASGEYLGVDISASRVVVYVLDRSAQATADGADQRLATRVEHELGVEVLATRGADALMLLVEAPDHGGALTMIARVKAALISVTDARPGTAIVGISSVCSATTLARGYREAREVALCIDRFARLPDNRVLAVDDLGPARLFLANSDIAAVRSYVDDVLGPLLTGSTGTADLLITLQHYFDRGRSVRATAAVLSLHENTIRLRLARVHALTGLDVAADANDQLSAQTALLLLRLRGDAPSTPWTAQAGRKLA